MREYDTITREFAEGHARDKLKSRAHIDNGTETDLPVFYRYIILDVVFDPNIIDAVKLEHWEQDLNVSNIQHARFAPRNAIIAKRVNSNNTSQVEPAMVLYPFFPPSLSLDCKPGEHVWVMFEDRTGTRNDLGYWFNRIVGPNYVEDVNYTHAPRVHDKSFVPTLQDRFDEKEPMYEFNNGVSNEEDGQRYVEAETSYLDGGKNAYNDLLTGNSAANLSTYEKVPRYKKRPNEIAIEGANNALIRVGRNHNGVVATYENDEIIGAVGSIPEDDTNDENKGMIDLVTGRGQTQRTGGSSVKNSIDRNELAKRADQLVSNEGDPDLDNDRSRVMIAQGMNVDEAYNLSNLSVQFNSQIPTSIQGVGNPEISDDNSGCVVLKSDKIRIVSRSDVEIIATQTQVGDDGNTISNSDTSRWAAIVLKPNGDIIIKPSETGYVKIGGDDADKAILCTDIPATPAGPGGNLQAAPVVTTMGGSFNTGTPGQGSIASRILVKS